MTRIALGVTDVDALPHLAEEPARWGELQRRMNRRSFLRSEGMLVEVDTPQVVSGELLVRSTELVANLNRFYRGLAATYYERPDLRPEFLVNPLFEPLLELEAEHHVTTPLSRVDTVLGDDGAIRVIEINSVGVCLFHMRGLFYLVRELARGGFPDAARWIDQLALAMVDGFVRFAVSHLPEPPRRLVIGGVTPSGWLRAGHLLFRAAFQRAGHDYVFGGPEHLEIDEREIRVRGTRIDVLWPDFLLYSAYQYARYKNIRFPSPIADYSQAPAQAAELVADRRFHEHLRARRVVLISPARSYLALPKALLSWVHRDDRPLDPDVRAFLARHVARTYSACDRRDGRITADEVVGQRGDYVIKPCQYGASYGVQLGRLTDPATWRSRIAEIWDDPTWAVQEFHTPVKTGDGQWVSLGLANFDGTLGGMFFRTSSSLLINNREAGFTAAVTER